MIPLLALFAGLLVRRAATSAQADEYTDTIALFKKAGQSSQLLQHRLRLCGVPHDRQGRRGHRGAHGKGRVYEKGKYIGDTSMTQVTIGFQLGGQAFSEIIFFEDQRALADFTSGNFEFGAEASAVAITAGASAKAGTTGTSAAASGTQDKAKTAGGYFKGMADIHVAKGGLMFEAALGGQKFNYKPR